MEKQSLDLMVILVKKHYYKYLYNTADQLADLINLEFDTDVKPEDVQRYIDPMSIDEEDAYLIYKHAGLV